MNSKTNRHSVVIERDRNVLPNILQHSEVAIHCTWKYPLFSTVCLYWRVWYNQL